MKAKQFSDYVSDVKNGGSANAVAHDIYDALTENERIALLQGSVPFWQGIDAMMGPDVGYNAQPFVMGAVERIGFPGSGSLMARADVLLELPRPSQFRWLAELPGIPAWKNELVKPSEKRFEPIVETSLVECASIYQGTQPGDVPKKPIRKSR